MKELDHNAVLNAAARDVLAPLGLRQKGRSRTWLDDRVWFLIVVEFQAGRTRGSYLNVGANWLWSSKPFLSFDYGYRVMDHEVADLDWPDRARRLAERARTRVTELRTELRDPATAAAAIAREAGQSAHGGTLLHAGIAAGLAGEIDRAAVLLGRLQSEQAEYDWHRALQTRAVELRRLLRDSGEFRAEVVRTIVEGRAALELPPQTERQIDARLVSGPVG